MFSICSVYDVATSPPAVSWLCWWCRRPGSRLVFCRTYCGTSDGRTAFSLSDTNWGERVRVDLAASLACRGAPWPGRGRSLRPCWPPSAWPPPWPSHRPPRWWTATHWTATPPAPTTCKGRRWWGPSGHTWHLQDDLLQREVTAVVSLIGRHGLQSAVSVPLWWRRCWMSQLLVLHYNIYTTQITLTTTTILSVRDRTKVIVIFFIDSVKNVMFNKHHRFNLISVKQICSFITFFSPLKTIAILIVMQWKSDMF